MFLAIFAGLIQSPFFDIDAPDYVNYAGIGYLYAREIVGVFDEQGK
jgi:predicted metalloendopeptidase